MLLECKLLVLNITFYSAGFYSEGLDSYTHVLVAIMSQCCPESPVTAKPRKSWGESVHYLGSYSWNHCQRQFLRVYAQTLEGSSCHYD